jgi:succinoglycan biosynthesis transport protein ExoP
VNNQPDRYSLKAVSSGVNGHGLMALRPDDDTHFDGQRTTENAILPALNTNRPSLRPEFSGGDDQRGVIRYLQALRAHWLLIVVLVGVGVGVAAAYSLSAAKRYEAEASLLVTPVRAPENAYLGISAFRESSEDPTRTVVTLARIINTAQAAQAARLAENLDLTVGELLGAVAVVPVSQSNLITIKSTASDPNTAAAIANGFAKGIVDVRTRQFQGEVRATIARLQDQVNAIPAALRESAQSVALQQNIAALRTLLGTQDPTLQIATPATPPASPSWPRPALSIVVAFLATLLLGTAVALVLELVSPRVNREEELIFEQRLPILARVPRLRKQVVRDYLATRKPLPQTAWEAYRTLRMNLAAARPGDQAPKTILVTSAQPRDGKTLTAVNLATSFARSGMKVILVDGDYRRPMLGAILGVSATSDSPSFLEDPSRLPSLLVPIPEVEGLSLLPASPANALLVDRIDPARVRRFYDALSAAADVVIVDSAPPTEVADTLPLADEADAVVIAVRLGHTRRDRLVELRWALAQHGVAPAGFVMTTRRATDVRASYYTTTTKQQLERESESESRRWPRLADVRARATRKPQPEGKPGAEAKPKPEAAPAPTPERRRRRRRRRRVSGTRSRAA